MNAVYMILIENFNKLPITADIKRYKINNLFSRLLFCCECGAADSFFILKLLSFLKM